VLISDGCFHPSGILRVSPAIDTPCIEELFRHKVLKLLLSQGRITEATIAVAYIVEPQISDKAFRKNLAPLIQKNLRGRSPGVPVVPGGHACDCRHRRSRAIPAVDRRNNVTILHPSTPIAYAEALSERFGTE